MCFSSHLYHSFDQILLLSHGRALYSGPGGFAPAQHFSSRAIPYKEGYNVADYLLEVASDPPVALFPLSSGATQGELKTSSSSDEVEKGLASSSPATSSGASKQKTGRRGSLFAGTSYAATFLTQFEVLSGREWKILRRDKSLFFLHVAVASVLGVFCGGYFDLRLGD